MLRLQNLFTFTVNLNKPRKIYKKKFYEALPHWHKPHQIDIHDGYKYRTKQQIMKQLKSLKFQVEVVRHIYPQSSDPEAFIKNRKAILQFCTEGLHFTHLQKERFKILMGCRYDENTRKGKMVCESFPQYEQNMEKLQEQIQEVIMEAKRAP